MRLNGCQGRGTVASAVLDRWLTDATRRRLLWAVFATMVLVAQPAYGAVEISGGLDAGRAWVGGEVSFWMRVLNTHTDASTFRVQVLGNSVELVALCAPLRGTDSAPCRPPAGQFLIAGQSESLFVGTLRVADSGDLRVTLQAVDQAGRVIAVALGSLSAIDRAWTVVEWVKNILVSLTLPFVLAFLGFKYQRRLQREQDEQRQRERELADRRAESEKQLSERATSVRLMLPVIHGYAIRYYVDLVGAYWGFARHSQGYAAAFKKPHSNDPAQIRVADAARDGMLREAALAFIKMHLVHREFYEQVGGMYLATIVAEELLTSAFARFDRSVIPPGNDTRPEVTRLLDALQETSLEDASTTPPAAREKAGPSRRHVLNRVKFDEFLASAKTEAKDAYDKVENRLKGWLETEGHEDGLACAQLYGDILNNEMNIALQQWYGDVPRLDVSSRRQLCLEICEGLDQQVRQQALKYLGLAG
jgi:hypothetical protein